MAEGTMNNFLSSEDKMKYINMEQCANYKTFLSEDEETIIPAQWCDAGALSKIQGIKQAIDDGNKLNLDEIKVNFPMDAKDIIQSFYHEIDLSEDDSTDKKMSKCSLDDPNLKAELYFSCSTKDKDNIYPTPLGHTSIKDSIHDKYGTCIRPSEKDIEGYNIVREDSLNISDFSVNVSCEEGYKQDSGGIKIEKCNYDGKPYHLSGCEKIGTCVHPHNMNGYKLTGEQQLSKDTNFMVNVECDQGYTSGDGNPSTEVCDGDGKEYKLNGCNIIIPESESEPGAEPTTTCSINEYVLNDACVACAAGTQNDAGDPIPGPDTTCEPILCLENYYVSNMGCTACAAGTENNAGDPANGGDTTCEPILCQENYYVSNNVCTACATGTVRAAGDPANGGDTTCEPQCSSIEYSVSCDARSDCSYSNGSCSPNEGFTNMYPEDDFIIHIPSRENIFHKLFYHKYTNIALIILIIIIYIYRDQINNYFS